MKKISLLAICIFCWSPEVQADEKEQTLCGTVESYVPPDSENRPHVLKTNFSDLVFWPESISKLEIIPWKLVCHEVCVLKDNEKWYKDRKTYTIRALHHIKVKPNKDCKTS